MDTTNSAEKQRHVLIVEDNAELAQTYQDLLTEHGFRISTAPNGVMALKCVMNQDVDAIVCDLKMPLLEGDMFYESIESTMPHLCKRFVILTGNAENDRYSSFLRHACVQVLSKPVASDQLLDALQNVLAQA